MAEQCMELFLPMQLRVDPLVTELCNTIRASEDSGVQASYMYVLGEVLKHVKTLSDANRATVAAILDEFAAHDDDMVSERAKIATRYLH
jgi:hypothetical protein